MSFFCAGSNSQSVKKKISNKAGSKSAPQPVSKSSSNGRVANPFQDNKEKSLPTIPFSDQPNTRRMVVLQEYTAKDNRGLSVHRGEQVQVLNEEENWYFVRNESKKEGFVPRSHLVAPYSSIRTGRKSQASNPIRPVASGSTVLDHDPSRGVPMYPSHSAGVPRGQDEQMMNRANVYRRRESSPQILSTTNETCNNNNVHGMATNGMTMAMYDQKYSPSSSSGVASMNGPSSPSFQSFPDQDNLGRQSSGSSMTQERNSLSSIEENGMEVHHNGYYPHDASQYEESGMRSHRTPSESNLGPPLQTRPLPHLPPQPDQEGVYLDKKMNHIYSTITNGEGPPPIPPREQRPHMPAFSASQPYPDSEMYIAPADAVNEQPGPHLNRPRVRSLSDVRARDGHRQVKPLMDYSEVYQGKIRSHRQNGYHHGNDTASEHSEGGSSNRSSSHRGSTRRPQHLVPVEHIAGSREFVPQEPRHLAHVPTQSSATQIFKFRKCLWGVYVVTMTFVSQDENELSVTEGEHVSVWNQDDQDWFWIVKHSTSEEGFVPSRILKEVVASEAQQSAGPHQVQTLPPVPPKQRKNYPYHQPQPQDSQFRQRSLSQDSRSTNQTSRSRGRLNSDNSTKSRSSVKGNYSVTSSEKTEMRETSPSTPPPPYSEHDQQQHFHLPHASHHPHHQAQAPPQHSNRPTRHHSLSHQHEHSVHSGGSHMQRTRSQGHVTRNRYGDQAPPPMQRYLSPTERYEVHPPASSDGGTLV